MNKVELDAQVNKLSVCNVCRSNLPQNTTYNKNEFRHSDLLYFKH